MLDQFIRTHNIDIASLTRTRRRVFLVGRFNQRRAGETDPELWLFTSRKVSDTYRKHFAIGGVRDLNYNAFVQALRPALNERLEYGAQAPNTAIPRILQYVSKEADDEKTASVVDVFDYLFNRANSTNYQPGLEYIRPRLPDELREMGSKHAGKGIFWLIRRSLHVFSGFQPRTHELVAAFANLFSQCARFRGMPYFREGAALPGGFPEKLIDFLYTEDPDAVFSTEGVDFSERPWDEILREPQGKEIFGNIVTSFRDALLGSIHDRYGYLDFRNQPLDNLARQTVAQAGDLAKQFISARDAFNGLRQVLRRKALISMVLDWVLKSYYELEEVRSLGPNAAPTERDEAVERAILERWKENRVAEPVRRPSLEEREEFSKLLTANFEKLLTALVSEGDAKTKAYAALPAELIALGAEIESKHPERVTALKGIVQPTPGESYQAGFVDMVTMVLRDVLCPELYVQPRLTEDELEDYFASALISTYMSAVALSPKDKREIRAIARNRLQYFQENIERVTQKILNKNKIQAILLDDIFEVFSSQEMQARMRKAVEVLREALKVRENAPAGLGASSISAIRPDPELQDEIQRKRSLSIERTGLQAEAVRASVTNIFERETAEVLVEVEESRTAEKTKAAAQRMASDGGQDRSQTRGPEGGPVQTGGQPRPEARSQSAVQPPKSKLELKIHKEVSDLVSGLLGDKPDADLSLEEMADKVVPEARKKVLGKKLMDEVGNNVRSFEQALYLIYQRYNENQDKPVFRNRVERLTLINAMLLFRKEIGLGTVSSNLFQLLLDLVQHMDQENPDPSHFISECSLTRYFDNVQIQQGGITDLTQTLDAQAHENLTETVNFVSELWGIRYLFERTADSAEGKQAEIIVINATAAEFIKWLKHDNLTANQIGAGERLRAGLLQDGISDKSIQPGLVYLTDAAFGRTADAKYSFVKSLSGLDLCSQPNNPRATIEAVVLPPLCISTPALSGDGGWGTQGRRWADAADGAPCPVLVVGPSPFLNDPTDDFRTYLPAGYLFAAHFLGCKDQPVLVRGVHQASLGRLRVIDGGATSMERKLEKLMWPEGDTDTFSFAADYYLYVILLLLATAAKKGGGVMREGDQVLYYKNFFRPNVALKDWTSTEILNRSLIGSNALRFAIMPEIEKGDIPLSGVNVSSDNGITENGNMQLVGDVAGWFNIARSKIGLY